MAESQIKSAEPHNHFKSLYEKAVRQIIENNTAFANIPNQIKNQFLNFYTLHSNEQLELMDDLSKIAGLPNEMLEMMSQFPYFDTIPLDIIKEIGSYLKKKEPKEDTHTSAFVATHKRLHALFQPDRLKDLLPQLLLYVATGKQDKVKKILDMHPELLLKTGTVTDYSGRTFKDISAYEYAYWAKDTHMCRMLEQYMDPETKAEMLKRCEAIEMNGLTYIKNGVEHKGSKHFDFTPLKNALKNYLDGYDGWFETNNWTAIESAWMKVGIAQRDIPVHVANEYCRKDRAFAPKPEFNERTLPRELTFHNHTTGNKESWFPLVISDSSGLGVTFAITRDSEDANGAGALNAWPGDVLLDWEAIDQLDKVRTDDLAQLLENLRSVEPAIDNGFSFP
ncbi:hypothetical protein [Legionella qingyii]|nr:hypothetical protein [Legionella qingyii]RUR25887.1 hypothetical protein ELY20_01700 [Legionella qingyii]